MAAKNINSIKSANKSLCKPQKDASPNRDCLTVKGARQNNLKGIDVDIPHNRLTVVTGLSGSGKSSLAFDTIYAEGRWRYMESLSNYARLFMEKIDRPLVDSIKNIRPSIALEQKNPVKTSRSTVGTLTELYDYLCLLYAKTGRTFCPECGVEVKETSPSDIIEDILKNEGKRAYILFPLYIRDNKEDVLKNLLQEGFIRIKSGEEIIELSADENMPALNDTNIHVIADRVVINKENRARISDSVETAFKRGCGRVSIEFTDGGKKDFLSGFCCDICKRAFEKPSHLLFSFNHPVSACPECKGFGNILTYDEGRIIPNENISLEQGAVEPWTKPSYKWWYDELQDVSDEAGIDLRKPYKYLSKEEKKALFEGHGFFHGINGFFKELEGKRYKLHIRVFLSRYKGTSQCPSCGGTRLRAEALFVKIAGKNIAELCNISIKELKNFFIKLALSPSKEEVAKEILRQIRSKIDFLCKVGLDYLSLNRQTKTLSGGEIQRVKLANQIGNRMVGTLYVLDEPSIGLHARDTERLVEIVKDLADVGNTLLVVEHDESVIKASDYILEMGPLSGKDGGKLVYSGDFSNFINHSKTITARYLRREESIPLPLWRRKGSGKSLILSGLRANNLKNITIELPLKTFICITGVSGSGKSTLVNDTLYNALARYFGQAVYGTPALDKIQGIEEIKGVKYIDQSAVSKTSRSNPVTYIGGFDEIRRFFSELSSAKKAGLTPAHFSFNLSRGRCDVCCGDGRLKIEMYFLADIYVTCEECNGKRFKKRILEVKYRGKNISDVLDMTVEEAIEFFPRLKGLKKKLLLLKDVGLGYLNLGQPATTLSGGEAQRLKIARELGTNESQDYIYIMDEPTTGLHPHDIKKLLSVINRLVEYGNTAVIVEHNLDVIKSADYIIDLGPEGGDEGGRKIAEGSPERVAHQKGSHTGKYLKKLLEAK